MLVGGGSSSVRDSDDASLTSPTVDSGFWLYANPMRVIQSLLVVRGRRAARRSICEWCVAFCYGDARAQDKCHVPTTRKIRTEKKRRNDFFLSRVRVDRAVFPGSHTRSLTPLPQTLWYVIRAASRRSSAV